MATRIGLEPTTPSVTGWCSNQLSYRAMIAQVRGCSPPERALLYPKNDFLSSRNLQKPQKTFREKRKSRPQAENGQNKTSGTIAPDVCGRGSKSRTHGTRFWRPLLYQLSYRAMIAQVHRFWRLTAGTCVIIPEKRAVVKHEFRKMSKKFWKV